MHNFHIAYALFHLQAPKSCSRRNRAMTEKEAFRQDNDNSCEIQLGGTCNIRLQWRFGYTSGASFDLII